MKLKFDPTKLLPVASMALGLAGMLVSNKMKSNEQTAMKMELKNELIKELTQKHE